MRPLRKAVQDFKNHPLTNEPSCIYHLLAAVLHEDIDAVKRILQDGVDIKRNDDLSAPLLMLPYFEMTSIF
jgi:hypothetical protein